MYSDRISGVTDHSELNIYTKHQYIRILLILCAYRAATRPTHGSVSAPPRSSALITSCGWLPAPAERTSQEDCALLLCDDALVRHCLMTAKNECYCMVNVQFTISLVYKYKVI